MGSVHFSVKPAIHKPNEYRKEMINLTKCRLLLLYTINVITKMVLLIKSLRLPDRIQVTMSTPCSMIGRYSSLVGWIVGRLTLRDTLWTTLLIPRIDYSAFLARCVTKWNVFASLEPAVEWRCLHKSTSSFIRLVSPILIESGGTFFMKMATFILDQTWLFSFTTAEYTACLTPVLIVIATPSPAKLGFKIQYAFLFYSTSIRIVVHSFNKKCTNLSFGVRQVMYW